MRDVLRRIHQIPACTLDDYRVKARAELIDCDSDDEVPSMIVELAGLDDSVMRIIFGPPPVRETDAGATTVAASR